MSVLYYLPKLRRGLWLTFGVYCLYDFCIKMFLISDSINWQSFNVITFFPSHDIKQSVFLILIKTIDDVINFKIYLLSSSKAMTDSKKEENENTKIWISRDRKEPFRWEAIFTII